MKLVDIAKVLPRIIFCKNSLIFLNCVHPRILFYSNMANTRRKGEVYVPGERGRPRTRPERTTPKRPYYKSGRYTKAKKAERAMRKSRRGDFKNEMLERQMYGKEYLELFGKKLLEKRRGNRGVVIDSSPIANVGWQRRGRKPKIANNVPNIVPFGASKKKAKKSVNFV